MISIAKPPNEQYHLNERALKYDVGGVVAEVTSMSMSMDSYSDSDSETVDLDFERLVKIQSSTLKVGGKVHIIGSNYPEDKLDPRSEVLTSYLGPQVDAIGELRQPTKEQSW